MQKIRLLVFPLDIDRARETVDFARTLALDVVGASSVMPVAEAQQFGIAAFHRLPFITDATFESEFLALLRLEQITHVYTPHGVVWTHLLQRQQADPSHYAFHLCQPSPYEEDWLRLAPSREWASRVLADNFVDALPTSPGVVTGQKLKHGQLVSLHRQFVGIPGQCDDAKLLALAHLARLLPKGDLVEVGSFQGRSAFAIGWLARHYRIGNLVCVDPWDNAKLEDQGEQARLATSEMKRERAVIDLDKIFSSFIGAISLLDNAGYIRDTSEAAIHVYRAAVAAGRLPANELDSLPVTGRIAMLHIDGNHRYDFVRKDIELWLPHVMPGGWLLLDDYVWAFGDGPKRAGDELLLTDQFDVAFTATDTLFLRKRQAG